MIMIIISISISIIIGIVGRCKIVALVHFSFCNRLSVVLSANNIIIVIVIVIVREPERARENLV